MTSTAWTSEQKCLPNSCLSRSFTLITCRLCFFSQSLKIFSKKGFVSSGRISSPFPEIFLSAWSRLWYNCLTLGVFLSILTVGRWNGLVLVGLRKWFFDFSSAISSGESGGLEMRLYDDHCYFCLWLLYPAGQLLLHSFVLKDKGSGNLRHTSTVNVW